MLKKWLCLVLGVCILLSLYGCKSKTTSTVPVLEIPEEEIPSAEELSASTRTTVVYYADAAGYLVPVACSVPWVDGIAKATLAMMVKNEENNMTAASMGLYNVLPENTVFDIDISNGCATVSLSEEANACATAEEEITMVNGIVCALTEFDSVDEVKFLINGYELATLKHGTDISATFTRGDVNLESLAADVSLDGVNKISLYFESEQSGAMVPVTRMVFSYGDIETAVLELLKGPKPGTGLLATLPSDASLLSVTNDNGVITINFSEEFVNIVNEIDGGKNAIKSLMLTCTQFEDVKEVKLQINGVDWEPETATMTVPTFVNTEDEETYIQLYE